MIPCPDGNISLAPEAVWVMREESIPSFKPNPLRYTNNMAGKACHVVGSATQVGLTQVLGLLELKPALAHPSVALRNLQHASRNSY